MRVSLYTESFKPYLSGVTVSVDTFAHGLHKLGHQVTVFGPDYPKFKEVDEYAVFRFPSLGTRFYPGFRLALPFSLRHVLYNRKRLPDIVHSHSPYQLGYLAQRFANKHQIPFVYHFHTLFTEYLHLVKFIPLKISRPIVIEIVRNYCKKCDLIITPTKMVKDILQNEYKVTQPIEVLPTGIKDEMVAKADPAGIREKYGVKPGEFLLQYCGRLSKEKNIEFLLKVFKEINLEIPETKLMIVAFGPHENFLKEMTKKLGIENKVIFTGRIEREEIYNYLKAGELFVCASKTETQGLVLSEAKACGRPAVAIDAAGVSNMVIDGNDGFLVPDDLKIFKEKTIELIKNKDLLKKFSENALKNAAENYLASGITKKLEKLYLALLAKNNK